MLLYNYIICYIIYIYICDARPLLGLQMFAVLLQAAYSPVLVTNIGDLGTLFAKKCILHCERTCFVGVQFCHAMASTAKRTDGRRMGTLRLAEAEALDF